MKLFDAHCHLQLSQFDADREAVIARLREKQVGGIIVGTDLETSRAGLELAKQYDFLWASAGLHPNDNLDERFDISKYEPLMQDPKVVAIGECGLDYFRSGDTDEEREIQKQRFVLQIELSLKIEKPLIIHCRNAHDDLLEILGSYKKEYGDKLHAVIHFFTGTGELAQKYLDLGCRLSFPGPITYTDMYDEAIRVVPLDKILCETDSPFAAPVPFRGKRNEPAYVEEVVKKIAAIKKIQ
ncbi:MAG: TatD family hydrolase [Patescibacteria group bacterium]|nr:TatD family hydrolase [Patescibacteria group bacterium]